MALICSDLLSDALLEVYLVALLGEGEQVGGGVGAVGETDDVEGTAEEFVAVGDFAASA